MNGLGIDPFTAALIIGVISFIVVLLIGGLFRNKAGIYAAVLAGIGGFGLAYAIFSNIATSH